MSIFTLLLTSVLVLYLFFMAIFDKVIFYLDRLAKGRIKKIKLCHLTD